MNLSTKQIQALKCIAASEALISIVANGGLPLYVEHLPLGMQHSWRDNAERARWLENMKTRGLITIDKGCFLRLTEQGRAALKAGTQTPNAGGS